jgi:tetratricopeptide repeat protein
MKRVLLVLSFQLLCSIAGAQNPLSFTVGPSGELPIGNDRLGIGGGVAIGAEYQLPFLPFISPRLDIGYSYLPTVTESGVNMIKLGGGVALRIGRTVSAHVGGGAGYYYGTISGQGGGNLYVRGFADGEFALSDSLAVGAGASYQWMADGAGGSLWSGIGVSVGIRYTVLTTRRIQIEEPSLDPVFPVLYKYYANESVGTLRLTNPGSVPMTDIHVAFLVQEYMTGPTVSRLPAPLEPGTTVEIPIQCVFSDEVLSLTEGDVVSARLTISYSIRGRDYQETITTPLELYDRHAITWSDDRRAAAYVTAKDPVILGLARPIAGWVRGEQNGFDPNLRIAMAVHTALGLDRISYVVDPRTPYVELSKDASTIDYLQFPINTLSYRAGDCDDLSILYAAMLQAVGVETAFLTIPGHIYVGVALGMPPDEARRTFLRPEDLIMHGGQAWIPLEVTLVQRSFLEAWTVGAEQWRSAEASDQASIYPISEAWSVYSPVEAITTIGGAISFPDQAEVEAAYQSAWAQFVARETRSRVSTLESRIAGSANSTRYENSLGVLYARYGLIDRALETFSGIVASTDYAPALVNMGNLLALEGELESAVSLYRRALDQDGQNPTTLLQLARATYALGQLEASAGYVDALRSIAPELISQFSYLDSGEVSESRASARGLLLEVMIWDEE